MARSPKAKSTNAAAADAADDTADHTSDGPADESADESADELADVDFESALEELEALVAQMEAGDLSLQASLTAFERGVKLTRHCQGALKNAELKVRVLTEQNTLEDLDLEDLDDS